MELYTRHNSGQDWWEDVEAYANGRSGKDPEVADYLQDISAGDPSVRIRRAAKDVVVYLSFPNHVSSRRVHNVLLPNALQPSDVFAVSEIDQKQAPVAVTKANSPVSTAHRWMWLALAIFSTIWGVVAGASLFAGVGVDGAFAIFGVLGNVVLALSLFRLGKATDLTER